MPTGLRAALCFILGSAAGFTEIVTRYRDEPLRAAFNRFGLFYMVINGLLSLSALGLLLRYPNLFPKVAGDKLMTAIVAGTAAMTLLRSKLFTFRTDAGADIPIGPVVIVDTLLRVFDRKIDRWRSTRRQGLVLTELADFDDFEFAARYIVSSLLSFQNLSQQEKMEIAEVIGQYRVGFADWPPIPKTMAAGYALLNIAGEENFTQVIDGMKKVKKRVDNLAAVSPTSSAAK